MVYIQIPGVMCIGHIGSEMPDLLLDLSDDFQDVPRIHAIIRKHIRYDTAGPQKIAGGPCGFTPRLQHLGWIFHPQYMAIGIAIGHEYLCKPYPTRRYAGLVFPHNLAPHHRMGLDCHEFPVHGHFFIVIVTSACTAPVLRVALLNSNLILSLSINADGYPSASSMRIKSSILSSVARFETSPSAGFLLAKTTGCPFYSEGSGIFSTMCLIIPPMISLPLT